MSGMFSGGELNRIPEEGRAAWMIVLKIPAVLAWAVYGAVWLLKPRFPSLPEPIEAATTAGLVWWILAGLIWIFAAR